MNSSLARLIGYIVLAAVILTTGFAAIGAPVTGAF